MIPMLFENRPKCPIYIYFGTRNTSPSATFARPAGGWLALLAKLMLQNETFWGHLQTKCILNTFNLSGQQGTAAKMSYEYIVPSTKWPPVQGLPQNLQTIRAVQPSKQPMHTGVKKLDFPSNFTCKK